MSTNDSATFEMDMRDLLRAKKDRAPDERKEPGSDYSSLVSQISGQSVHEIDHLLDGLQGVREKLNNDGDRIHREIVQHVALSQSIVQLTEVITDAVASVNKAATAVAAPSPPKDAA